MEKEKVHDEAALIDDYLSIVAEIKKRRKISVGERKEYLKRLLTPLVKLSKPYFNRDSTYNFMNEDIRIDKEINIDHLIYDKNRYSIERDPLNDKSFHPDRSSVCIYDDFDKYHAERNNKEKARLAYIEQLERAGDEVPGSLKYPPAPLVNGGITSIREHYKKWLPTLTQEVIKSKDLLDQILVCFTIKRALNGDKEAIDKLCSLYEDAATRWAYQIAEKRKLYNYIEDIKHDAQILLRQIISGFSPQEIIINILTGGLVPLWFEIFYYWYYSEYVPEELNKIMKQPPHAPFLFPKEQPHYKELNNIIINRSRKNGILSLPSEVLRGMAISYYLDPYAPMRHDTFFKSKSENRRVMKFSSYSFRPNKKSNLTTWLFGNKVNPRGFMSGRFCQLLKEAIKKYQSNSGRSYKANARYQCPKCGVGFRNTKGHLQIECPSCFHILSVERLDKGGFSQSRTKKPLTEKKQRQRWDRTIDVEEFNKALKDLVKKGIILQRNADIFQKNTLEEPHVTQDALSKEYGLHRVQISRICNDVKTRLQKSLKP